MLGFHLDVRTVKFFFLLQSYHLPYVRESRTVLDSRYWIPVFVSGIPGFLSCIPDSKTQDSAFHEQKFRDSGIRIPIHGAMSLFFFLTLNVLNPMFSSFTKLVSITDSHNEDEPTLASFLTSLDTHMRTHPLCKPLLRGTRS